MQDAFTKTVPIWCAVLNSAVSHFRCQSEDGREHDGPLSDELQWDCHIHLPPWVSQNEANHISARLDGWTKELLQVR